MRNKRLSQVPRNDPDGWETSCAFDVYSVHVLCCLCVSWRWSLGMSWQSFSLCHHQFITHNKTSVKWVNSDIDWYGWKKTLLVMPGLHTKAEKKCLFIYVSRHTFYLLGLTYRPVFPSYIRHPTTSVLWHFLWNHWRWCDLTQRVPNHHMNHNGPHEVKASALWAVLFCVWHMWT